MKRRKKPAGEGYAFTFHGSYTEKESRNQGSEARRFLISRIPRG